MPAASQQAAPKPKQQFSKSRYLGKAPRSVVVTIAGVPVQAELKAFSTGSVGFFANAKIAIEIDGIPVTHQVGLNLTAHNSKEWGE